MLNYLLFSLISIGNIEKNLRDYLFTDYSSATRPSPDNKPLNLDFSIALRAFNAVDQVDGILSTNIWMRHYWNDIHLRWNPEDYTNITSIAVNTDPELDHNIWIPDMYLYNTAEKPMDNMDYSRAILYYNGDVIWSRPGILRSTCSFDLEYFPYDRQKCYLKFGSWVYHKSQMNISIKYGDNYGIDSENFQLSDGWDVLGYNSSYNEVKYQCCPEIYPDITFEFYLERKSGYYDLNIIIPTYATASLMIISLIVPWDSGERISFAITVMLSLIVFLLILSESLPKTDASPLLSKMLIGLTFFSLFVVFFTVIISALYSYKNNKDTPLFKCIRYAKDNPVVKRFSNISKRNTINNTEYELENEPENELEKISIGDNKDDLEYRTSSYTIATEGKTSTIKKRKNSFINENISGSDILSNNESSISNSSNTTDNSIESKKSIKMYRDLAAHLELIFTCIFFISFIFFSFYMFSLVPY